MEQPVDRDPTERHYLQTYKATNGGVSVRLRLRRLRLFCLNCAGYEHSNLLTAKHTNAQRHPHKHAERSGQGRLLFYSHQESHTNFHNGRDSIINTVPTDAHYQRRQLRYCQPTETRNILDRDQSNVLLAHYFPLTDERISEISRI